MIKNKFLRFFLNKSFKKINVKNFRLSKKMVNKKYSNSYRSYESNKRIKEFRKEKLITDFKKQNIGISEIFLKIEKEEKTLTVNDIIDFLEDISNYEKFEISKIKEKKEFSNLMKILKTKLNILEKKIIPYAKISFSEKEKNEDDLLKWVQEENERTEINREKPKIGKLSYLLKNLDYLDYEIWKKMENFILDDKILKTFNDSVDSLEGFTVYQKILENYEKISQKIQKKGLITKETLNNSTKKNPKIQKIIRNLYKKLEYNMLMSLLDTNIKYYSRIISSLVSTKSPNNLSFASLESHIINNLSMEHNIDNSFDIYCNFAISNQGSKKLFEQIEVLLYIGSDNNYFNLRNRYVNNFFCDGKKIGDFLEAASYVKNRFPEKEVNLYVTKKVLNSIEGLKNLDANFLDLKKILFFLPVLELDESPETNVVLSCLDKSGILIGKSSCKNKVEDFLFFLKGKIQGNIFDKFLIENKKSLKDLEVDYIPLLEGKEEDILLLEGGVKNTFKKIKNFFN